MWGFIIAAIATIFVGVFTAKTQQASAKKTGSQASHTAEKIAAEQTAAGITLADKQAAADKEAEAIYLSEKKIQDEKLAALQEKQLKIQAQQFNIETLAGILRDRKTVSDTPVIYQTPPARQETGFFAQINNFFHNILRG